MEALIRQGDAVFRGNFGARAAAEAARDLRATTVLSFSSTASE